MHCFGVAVLRVLDQKDHQKGDDGRRGVDDQLPSVGKMKRWSGENPNKNEKHCSGKSPRAPESDRRMAGENAKRIACHAKEIPLLFLLVWLFRLGFHSRSPLSSHATRKVVANSHGGRTLAVRKRLSSGSWGLKGGGRLRHDQINGDADQGFEKTVRCAIEFCLIIQSSAVPIVCFNDQSRLLHTLISRLSN